MLAWSILVVLVAAGMKGSVPPAQANIRTASSTTQVTLASTLSVAAAPKTVARPVSRYAVRPGDTLSGIAARFAVRGGWPALYAANRPLIGSDPNVIHAGTVLVLPGRAPPVRYTVAAGDTLAGIAAALAVRGGWPALYAANRRAIGPDPNTIRPGTVLTVRRPAAPACTKPGPPPAPGAPGVSGQREPSCASGNGRADRQRHAAVAEDHAADRRPWGPRSSPSRCCWCSAGGCPPMLPAVPEQAREPVLVPRPRYGREPDPGVLPRRRPASSWPISTRLW